MTDRIESPQSYGEVYWAMQVEAQKTFEEEVEKSVKPFIPNIFSDPEIRASMPFDVLGKLEGLLDFPSPGLGAVGGRFVSEIADQAVGMIMTPALRKTQYAANRLFHNLILPPDACNSLFRRKRLSKDAFDYRYRAAGYSEFEQQFAYTGSSPFPAVTDLLRWARYHGDPDNTWATMVEKYDFDPVDYPMWEWLSRRQLAEDRVTSKFKRGQIVETDAIAELRKMGWSNENALDVIQSAYLLPNAMILTQGNLFRQKEFTEIITDISRADIHPDYAQIYYDAILTKPNSTDLIAYHLRQSNDLANLDTDLQRIGIHPEYLDIYKTLAHRLPPLADIITMAVREAFSPEVARRFGQYEDFPREFGEYAEMQGLTEEWSKRYWAAHWGLPSVTQGFNMLHRGIIDRDDLVMLLKAQDVMPFWRDKLIQMAYRPFTRIDVRRMYQEGVLDEKGVYQAYLNLGYDDDNAEAMTEYVLRQTLSKLAKFTTSDVIKAYTQRMIDRGESSSLLRMLGVQSKDVSYILSTADYKKEWALIDGKTRAIRNLYKRGEYAENIARSELFRLNLPSEQVTVLMEQWWYERKEDPPVTWTKAETLKFLKTGMIDKPRAQRELQIMGYDDEHIEVYLRGATLTPKKD